MAHEVEKKKIKNGSLPGPAGSSTLHRIEETRFLTSLWKRNAGRKTTTAIEHSRPSGKNDRREACALISRTTAERR